MSRRGGHDVAIIGAGVVGAACALALARHDLRVRLVEAQAPRPWREDEPDLRVYALASDGRNLLDELDVWPAIAAARVQPYRCMRVWDAGGGEELRFDADDFGRPALGDIVEHGLLVDRLWQAIAREPRIERLCPARLQSLADEGDDGVRYALDSGDGRARLLLGADGAASRVRELAGIGSDAHAYGQRAIVAYVRTERPHEATAWQRFLPTGPLAFLPWTDGRCSIVWSLPDAEAERLLAADEASFCRELTRAFDARLGEVTAVSARAAFPLRRQLATTMLQGRVGLIGDAAHAVHPLAGQGVNLGLRDVAALAEMVAVARAAGRDPLSPASLARWARTRRSENAVAAHSFETINRVFSNEAVLPTLLRGRLLGAVGRVPPLARFLWRRAAGSSQPGGARNSAALSRPSWSRSWRRNCSAWRACNSSMVRRAAFGTTCSSRASTPSPLRSSWRNA